MAGLDERVAGFALGALLHDAGQPEKWADVIPNELAERVRARLREVRTSPDKRMALAELIASVRPAPAELSALPTVARAQLARTTWRAAGLALRTNHVPDSDLLTMLQRIAPRLGAELG